MRIGGLEIIYLKTGLEGGRPESKVVIGFGLRKYYITAWIRVRPNFFRHLLLGLHVEGIEFLCGINK